RTGRPSAELGPVQPPTADSSRDSNQTPPPGSCTREQVPHILGPDIAQELTDGRVEERRGEDRHAREIQFNGLAVCERRHHPVVHPLTVFESDRQLPHEVANFQTHGLPHFARLPRKAGNGGMILISDAGQYYLSPPIRQPLTRVPPKRFARV